MIDYDIEPRPPVLGWLLAIVLFWGAIGATGCLAYYVGWWFMAPGQ